MGFPPRDREGAAEYSHLHSAGLEILVRFGLAGALMAFTILAVMARAYRCLSDRELGDQGRLRHFLLLAGAMTLIFCAYDFRLLNTEFRFFLILYLGILYSFRVHACCFPQYSGTSLQDSPTSPPAILPTLQHHAKGNHKVGNQHSRDVSSEKAASVPAADYPKEVQQRLVTALCGR